MMHRSKMYVTHRALALGLFAWGLLSPGHGTLFAQQVEGQKILTLQEAVSQAVARNPKVEEAQAQMDASTESKRGAWSNIGPRATVVYNETHFPNEQKINFGGQDIILRDDLSKTGTLTVEQTITGLYAAVQYGRLKGKEAELSFEGLRQAKRDVGFQAAEAFLNAYQAQEQFKISESSLNAAKRQYEDALAIQRVGRLSQGDVLKFQLSLSQAESRHAQAQALNQLSIANLRQIIQAKDDEVLALDQTLPTLEEENTDIQKGIAEALTQRPEVKRAALTAELADFGKDIAYAQFIPNVKVFKKWDKNFGEVSGFGGEKELSYYGVSLQWEIWGNGSSVFAVREAISKKNQAEAVKASATDGIKLDVISAWQNFQAAKQSLRFAQTGVAQAEEAYRIDQTRFKNGQISATDLIFSESSKSAAQGNKVAAETQYILWHFRLQRSIGKELPLAKAAS